MGSYNPSAPAVLGQEWVPVRPEPYPVDIGRETGHGFRLVDPTEVTAGRFFLFAEPARAIPGQAVRMNIYPAGLEGASGPIQRAVVPVNFSSASGSVGAMGGAPTLTSAVTYASDGSYVRFGTGAGTLRMHFNTGLTGTGLILVDKRILSVNLLYALAGDLGALDGTTNFFRVGIGPGSADPSVATFAYADASLLVAAPTRFTADTIARLPCGDLNPWWDYPTQSWEDTSERLPWRRAELLRLENSATDPYGIVIDSNLPATSPLELSYVALEILYCEEQRVAYGATGYGTTPEAGPALNPYITDDGPNTVVLRDLSFTAAPVLAEGAYTMTVTVGDLGPLATLGSTPTVNALRQLYAMPDQPGITVSAPGVRSATQLYRLPQVSAGAPTRATIAVDTPAMVAETTDLLPHLTLINDDGIVTAVHPYGVLFPAAVFDPQVITQEIWNPVADGGSYTFVRFWCRQFAASPLPLTVSYRAVGGGPVLATAQLLPAAFAALDEIVDGWKEVTLLWDTPVTITPDPVNVPEVEWRCDGLPEEEQWQIIAADGLGAVGGDSTGPATYGAPDGEDYTLIRLPGSPASLVNVDAPVLLSQSPPAVTGLAVTVEELALAGVGEDCALAPRGVPTAVYYHRVTWDPIAYPTQLIADTFRRTEVAQWGTADLGGAWTNVGGVAADFNVVDGVGGQHDIDNLSGALLSVIGAGIADVQVLAEMSYSPGPVLAGGNLEMGIILRYVDANNYYLLSTNHSTGASGGVTLRVSRVVAGVTTVLASTNLPATLTSATRLRATAQGTSLSVSLYDVSNALLATVGAVDASHAAGAVGFYTEQQATNVDPHTVTLSAISATTIYDPTIAQFGQYELQRADAAGSGWETVATATSPDAAEFNDYEARVGIESTYRIRACNSRDFCGPWSDEVPSTIPAPGVVGTCVDSGVLIFSSNAVQDGTAVLAYVQTWDSTSVAEVFDLPEAATAQLQRMLDRDYVVAFRPAERGGMRFTRTLLVQAAAVPIPVLDRGFQSLRDLAWQDLPYLAVRTEGADRWLSTVLVPQGVFRDLRRLQLATVEIVEVTDTPAAATPGACEGMVSRARTVYAQTAHTAAFTWSTGFDLRVRIRLDDWLVPGSPYVDLASNYHPDTGGGWAFTYYRGTMNLFLDDLSASDTYDAAPILPEPGEMLWLRVVWVRDNGGGDSQAEFYTSPDGVVWTAAGGAQTSPFQPFAAGTGPLFVGADPDLGAQNRGTTIAQASIADDTGTTVFASPDFTAHPAGTTTFVDEEGNLWELVGGGTCQR